MLAICPSHSSLWLHNSLWIGKWHPFLEGQQVYLHLQSQMAPTTLSISLLLSHLENELTPTLDLFQQVISTTPSPSTSPLSSLLPDTSEIVLHWSFHPSADIQISRELNSYSLYIPQYRLSYTSTGTITPSLLSCSIPMTVTYWLPRVVSTLNDP